MTEGIKKELRPLLFSLLFLGLGVFVLWVANYLLQCDPATSIDDVVLVSLLVMPILIYAIISGSLTELKGPGWSGSDLQRGCCGACQRNNSPRPGICRGRLANPYQRRSRRTRETSTRSRRESTKRDDRGLRRRAIHSRTLNA